jgi:hypothetical protein
MTAQQPQRCCEQCKNIPCKVLDRVECTRPHTPAPDTMTISVKEFEQYIKDKQESRS